MNAEPVLVVWAELSVVAHLIGEPMPVLTSDLLDALARFDSRHRECVLSHAVDQAVAVRTMAFATLVSPDDLAVHVNAAMNSCVIDNVPADDTCEWRRRRIDTGPRETDRRLILHGADSPSGLETAVGCRADTTEWPARLARTLAEFVPRRWPMRYFGGPR